MRRVALVGAGFIARAHAEALQLVPNVAISAVIDPNLSAANALSKDFGASPVFASVQEGLAADAFDCAHVLVPPDHHAAVTRTLLDACKPVLLEKPLATTGADCDTLVQQADATGTALGVNQNFVHHPAFRRLLGTIRENGLGRPNHVTCTYNVPLRQITARQFNHWMFASPLNLLLEQAVHPLSQIIALAGAVSEIRTLPGPALDIAPGQTIYPTLDALVRCERLPASLRFAVGQAFPAWHISVVCDDGVATADILGNRFVTQRRTQWLDAVDGIVSGTRTASALVGGSMRNASNYGLSMLKLKTRSDAFFQSMLGSIRAFHSALDANRSPDLDARFGAILVRTCEQLVAAFPQPAAKSSPLLLSGGEGQSEESSPDLSILGGTGFIGAHLVRRALDQNLRLRVMARNTRGLPDIFSHPNVTLMRGDIRDPASVQAAVENAPIVINLAHGGGGSSWDQVRSAMVGGAEMVARACVTAKTRRLVHVGSIAGLYLGPQSKVVTGETPPDPHPDHRADYARAKAVCDRLLLDMHKQLGLPVVILRPGVVVGEGGPPFHGGLGFFNNDQHCIGWNDGRNPLPFVLVEDVADAILKAAYAGNVEGKAYNIVGDIRPSAREYISGLGAALKRPLKFHPQSPARLWMAELGKWGIKRAGGRRPPLPSIRDLLSRGMRAQFDCSDAKRDLDWTPVADPAVFEARAILVHAG